MVVFINSKTAVPNVQLEEIRQNAIQATQTAQDQVYEYSGEKPFDKPAKPKNPKTVTVSASVSEKSGKHGAWWRITLWILVACEKMSLVPASIWMSSLATLSEETSVGVDGMQQQVTAPTSATAVSNVPVSAGRVVCNNAIVKSPREPTFVTSIRTYAPCTVFKKGS